MKSPHHAPFPPTRLPIFVLTTVILTLMATPMAAEETCDNVCDQTYALCIAATCSDNGDGTATCGCVVESGWSIGPTGCSEREPVVEGDVTHLVSTFSAALYDSDPFYQGSGASTDCYGDPCTTADGETATCTCRWDDGHAGNSWWTEAACGPAPAGMAYSAAGSPFSGGDLARLAALIAECSGTTAPAPQACSGD